MDIQQHLEKTITEKGGAYLVLLDPDKIRKEKLGEFVKSCEKANVDGFLIGGSLLFSTVLDEFVKELREQTSLPKIIFPGDVNQVSPYADAILFLSLISGRNPEHLIGKHVIAAPLIKKSGIEPISTGYMLIESGVRTTAEYMSGGTPIPANKPEIAVATALAAQYLGMKYIYLEAGSGAERTVPFEMVKAVSHNIDIPVIVGGGIRKPETAAKMVKSGAKVIVTGNFFESENNWDLLSRFADAVHSKNSVYV